METFVPPNTNTEIQILREGIRTRYRIYHQADPDRYPALEFNTNRDNYAPLYDSFEHEFYRKRGYDRQTATVKIPSTNTLARLFTDDDYWPGKKILNTCYSYAQGATQPVAQPLAAAVAQAEARRSKPTARQWVGALVGVLILGGVGLGGQYWFKPTPSGLVITSPKSSSTVPRSLVVGGRVTNAETVWLVVRSKASKFCWVQAPLHVADDGHWVGLAYVGRDTTLDDGYGYQLRALVNPAPDLHVGDLYADWPQAEVASDVIDVVRGKCPN